MPRKTHQSLDVGGHLAVISMRPRPDAAENPATRRRARRARTHFNEAAARCRGKPPFDYREPPHRDRHFNEAAARCRGKPGDLAGDAARPVGISMRPRPDAAENPAAVRARVQYAQSYFNEAAARCRGKPLHVASGYYTLRGFNEAAARCRGKPRRSPRRPTLTPVASMRPRPDAAENPTTGRTSGRNSTRFNEAAARCRGKPPPIRRERVGGRRLLQ